MPSPFDNKAVLANPAAHGLYYQQVRLDPAQQNALDKLANSAHLAITAKDYDVLRQFYETTKSQDSKLGALYHTLSFEQFIERLVTKRFDKAYLDGRQIFPRQHMDEQDPLRKFYNAHPVARVHQAFNRCNMLDRIGTDRDEFNIYKEYLSLAELNVSAMVLMVMTDVVLGQGARGRWSNVREMEWYDPAVREEFFKKQAENSALAVVYSYPAGIEFRNLDSAALDTVYCLVKNDKDTHSEFNRRREMAINNPALGKTLHGFYGDKSALSFDFEAAVVDQQTNPAHWIVLNSGLMLYKPAYQAKIERVLKQIILAHDQSMAELGMGKVLNLKGLGLGAFGIKECNGDLENIFLAALHKVHAELAPHLQYISCINFINPPSQFNPRHALPTPLQILADTNGVKLTTHCMEPTAQYIVKPGQFGYGTAEYEVGGVIFCGDPATLPGNEARIRHPLKDGSIAPIGLYPDSSDDPAQMYTMLQPTKFDPIANPVMLHNCTILREDMAPSKKEGLGVARETIQQIKDRLALPLCATPDTTLSKEEAPVVPSSAELLPQAPSIAAAPAISTAPAIVEHIENDDYPTAFKKLQGLLNQHQGTESNRLLRQLLSCIHDLEGKTPENDLKKVLNATYHRLQSNSEIEKASYETLAKTMQGHPSTGLKVLGGIMLALAIATLVLGIVFFPAIVVGATAIVGAGAAVAVAGATVGVTSASLLGVSAIGFFAGSQRGLSNDMSLLNKETNLYTSMP